MWSRNHEYSILLRKDLWSYYQSKGLKFRYTLRKMLGTQDHPTLRLASHHCVLCLNLIKSIFNTCSYTHTHTNIHLSTQHGIFIPKQHIILKQESQTHKNLNIHLTYENPIIHLKHGSNLNMATRHINILQTLIIDLSMFHYIIKVKP